MNVLIIGERRTTISQLRFALSASRHPCSVTCVEPTADPAEELVAVADSIDLVLVAMPADEDEGIQLLRRLRPISTARLVTVGVAESPQQILKALHAGADDFLDEAADLHQQVADELERVAMHTTPVTPEHIGRLIAVTAASGGVGTTLTAANLAVAIAQEERFCGLIDLSSGFGELASLFGLKPQHSMAALSSNLESLDFEMLINSMTEHESGVKLIASAATSADEEYESTDATLRIVQTACQMLPSLVMDINRRAPFAPKMLECSDIIVLLTTLDFKSACSTRSLLDSWSERGIDLDRVLVVGNRCQRKGELDSRRVESVLDRPIAFTIAEDCLSANLSVNCGNPILVERPRASLSKDYLRLERLLRERYEATHGEPPETPALSAALRKTCGNVVSRAAGLLF